MITYKDFGVQKETATLSNGVKILHFNKKNSPISITFASKSGSRYDPDGKEGLAHLVEHAVLLGSKKFKDKKDLTYFIEGAGGIYGAYTTTEFTALHFCVGDKKLLPYIQTAAEELFNNARFDENKIESEKKIISNEIDKRENNTNYHLTKGSLDLMIKNHLLTKDIIGSVSSLNNIIREDLISHYKNRLPRGMCIFSCGDVELKTLTKTFEGLLPNKKSVDILHTVDITKIKVSNGFYKKDVKIPSARVSFPICTLKDYKESIKLRFLASLLGRGRNSLLEDKFRNEENILYGIHSGIQLHPEFGYFFTDFQIEKEKIQHVVNGISRVLVNIKNGKIDEKHLLFLKSKIINSRKLSYQTSDGWAESSIPRALLINDTEHDYISFLNDIKKVSIKDLIEVANKYFVEERKCVFAVGNLEEKDLGQ